MKLVLLATVLFVCASVTNAQRCVTQEDVKRMVARIEAQPVATPTPEPSSDKKSANKKPALPAGVDKKLKEELEKMALKQRDLLQEIVAKDQTKQSDREKLHKLYEKHTVRLCEILKTSGWPTARSSIVAVCCPPSKSLKAVPLTNCNATCCLLSS